MIICYVESTFYKDDPQTETALKYILFDPLPSDSYVFCELKDFLGIESIIFDESNDNLGMGPDKIFCSLLSARCNHI